MANVVHQFQTSGSTVWRGKQVKRLEVSIKHVKHLICDEQPVTSSHFYTYLHHYKQRRRVFSVSGDLIKRCSLNPAQTLLLTSVKVNWFHFSLQLKCAVRWLYDLNIVHHECERRQTQHLEEILFIFMIQSLYKLLLNIIRSRFVEDKQTDPRRNSREPFKDSENQDYNCNSWCFCVDQKCSVS